MSDDEDYMSDKFLSSSEKPVSSSLMYRYSDKREFALRKKKAEIDSKMKERKKSLHIVEAEKREQGLSSAISSANKGFEMLLKMGYKPGQGIGKSQSGMIEPIPMQVKIDRQGLGKILKKKEDIDGKLHNINTLDFRSRIAQEKNAQLQRFDLFKSQKICQQLDTNKNMEEPDESWFWPENKEEKIDGNEDGNKHQEDDTNINDISFDNAEKLDIITKYLRKRYFYCIWCGMRFNDQDDLRDNCPGSTRNDH